MRSVFNHDYGFPLLSGAGRLVIKDATMAGAALVTMADSAKAYLRKTNAVLQQTSAPELSLTAR